MIVVNTPPKLTDQEKRRIVTYFGSSYQEQSIENNSKIILDHLLKRLNVNKSSAPPSRDALKPAELVILRLYSIELKYYCLSFLIFSKSDSLYVLILP